LDFFLLFFGHLVPFSAVSVLNAVWTLEAKDFTIKHAIASIASWGLGILDQFIPPVSWLGTTTEITTAIRTISISSTISTTSTTNGDLSTAKHDAGHF